MSQSFEEDRPQAAGLLLAARLSGFTRLEYVSQYAVWFLLVVVILVGAVASPHFLTPNNIFNVMRQAAALAFVSLGQTFAIMADCVDISVGSMISLTQCLAAGTMNGQAAGILPALGLIAGAVAANGLANGLAVAKRKGNPFIVTLGSMAVVQGVVLLYTGGSPLGSVPDGVRQLAEGYVGPAPFPVVLVVVLFLLAHVALRRTRYGRYVLAVGGNEEIARLSGIRTARIKVATYLLSSAAAALTGIFLAARMNIGDPLVGVGFDLDSIAAVVIGGTDIAGGRGSIVGTMGGVLLYAVLNNLMNVLNVSPFYQIVAKGAVMVIAISVYQLRYSR
jgi:ribose transport system permease protein